MFPLVTINAAEEKATFVDAVERAKAYGVAPPAPSIPVRLHGKTVEKLGEWNMNGHHYAAVREPGVKDYHCIHPRYIHAKQ